MPSLPAKVFKPPNGDPNEFTRQQWPHESSVYCLYKTGTTIFLTEAGGGIIFVPYPPYNMPNYPPPKPYVTF